MIPNQVAQPEVKMALSEDGKSVVATHTQNISKAQLTQQLSQLQAQASRINDAISKVQESLDLFPKEELKVE